MFHHSCQVTRRQLLGAASLSLGGLTLTGLEAGSTANRSRRQKSLIMIYLSGGMSHLDTYDMKPGAPAEYRGEFEPTQTNVSGVDICNLLPHQTKLADRFAIVRGVQQTHLHTANEFYSARGWQENPRAPVPGEAQRPALGSVVSRLRRTREVPAYVSINNNFDWEEPYWLGREHAPFRFGGNASPIGFQNMQGGRVPNDRLRSRSNLLQEFDQLRRRLDFEREFRAVDALHSRALDMVTSGKVHTAFDLSKEPDSLRQRYGNKPFRVIQQSCIRSYTNQSHPGEKLLQARRLVEAGVSVVTICIHGWDTHRYNFEWLGQILPHVDQAVSALVTDLEQRGLLDDVGIMMAGEFGRRPKIGDITPDGRGHWPEAGAIWFAGGGFKGGQIIGATDSKGESPIGTPFNMQNIHTTLYQMLGVDLNTTFPDFNGRPQYLVDEREPIKGLLD